ncbi:hypothetical protein Tco_0425667 [Tanacetum coccineum]
MVTESLEQDILAKESSQPQSSYEAAATLTEFELKKILINKMDKSESYLEAPEHRECYEGLIKSLISTRLSSPLMIKLMRSNELYKFSDRTLTGLQTSLDDITKNIRIEYLPKRRWSTLEKKRADIMIKAIDKQLKERRMARSLKKFIGKYKDDVGVQIFYDHVNLATRRTIDQSASGKLRDKNTEESWALIDDLDLYDNERWNDPRDFAKPLKAISLTHDVPKASDRRLIELENQVQRLMEAHLNPKPSVQVNKIASSYEICSGAHELNIA